MQLRTGTQIQTWALLFDMDGTLVNSIAVIERLWTDWSKRHGIPLRDILAIAHGRPTIETMRLMAPHLHHEEEAAEYTRREISETEGVIAIDGATTLLRSLPRNRWCIVTSASRNLAAARLTAAGIPPSQHLVTVDDVRRPKPHAECYLLAADRLGFKPEDCLVFEDAPAGLVAARSAGMRSIAVATTMTADELRDQPWIPDLSAINVTYDGAELELTVC